MTVREWLQQRADSYSRDAVALRQMGDIQAAVIYETLRDELRACAVHIDGWRRA